jgi:hypothetical protein
MVHARCIVEKLRLETEEIRFSFQKLGTFSIVEKSFTFLALVLFHIILFFSPGILSSYLRYSAAVKCSRFNLVVGRFDI